MKTDYFDKSAQQFANLMSDINDREDPASRGQLAKALDHHCGEYTQFLSAEPHRTQVRRRQRLFTPFPLREIPVPDTRIYDIQLGERGRDLRAERIEIVSGLLLPFLRVPQGNTQENNL